MFFLWVRNFWHLVIIILVASTPTIVFEHYERFPRHPRLSGTLAAFVMIGSFSSLVLIAAKVAAILGLLRQGPRENVDYQAIWKSVKESTWTLFRLTFLIAIIAILLATPFALIMRITGPNKFLILFLTSFFLVLVKYALADPLVVIENLKAWPALKKSWEMTKGHFGYVLGCYVFLWFCDWSINWAVLSPVDAPESSLGWAWFPAHLAARIVDSLWLILSWCMYLRIKETGALAKPALSSPSARAN
jgi:hypothetical protein